MIAPLMLNINRTWINGNRHSLEQEEEVKSEQLVAKEACISWKWRPDDACYKVVIVSRNWALQQSHLHLTLIPLDYIYVLGIYGVSSQNVSANLCVEGS